MPESTVNKFSKAALNTSKKVQKCSAQWHTRILRQNWTHRCCSCFEPGLFWDYKVCPFEPEQQGQSAVSFRSKSFPRSLVASKKSKHRWLLRFSYNKRGPTWSQPRVSHPQRGWKVETSTVSWTFAREENQDSRPCPAVPRGRSIGTVPWENSSASANSAMLWCKKDIMHYILHTNFLETLTSEVYVASTIFWSIEFEAFHGSLHRLRSWP